MRAIRLAGPLAVLLLAAPAAAQLSNHGIAVESGLAVPLRGEAGSSGTIALSASAWLTGELEGVARVAYASTAGTGGRPADPAWTATVGLRLSLGGRRVRPQAYAEAGWTGGEKAGVAVRLGAALEAFVARDLSISARAGLRAAGGAAAGEGILALAAYF